MALKPFSQCQRDAVSTWVQYLNQADQRMLGPHQAVAVKIGFLRQRGNVLPQSHEPTVEFVVSQGRYKRCIAHALPSRQTMLRLRHRHKHHFGQGSLLLSEQSEDRILEPLTGSEDISDLLELPRYLPIAFRIARIDVLRLAPDYLDPAEILPEDVQRAIYCVITVLGRSNIGKEKALEKFLLEDVVQPGLEVEGCLDQRLSELQCQRLGGSDPVMVRGTPAEQKADQRARHRYERGDD